MPDKELLVQRLTDALTNVALDYLHPELLRDQADLRLDSLGLNLPDEARRISATMAPNILTTLDVHLRQLLYPGQQQRAEDWLRTQNYMHRREDQQNRPA